MTGPTPAVLWFQGESNNGLPRRGVARVAFHHERREILVPEGADEFQGRAVKSRTNYRSAPAAVSTRTRVWFTGVPRDGTYMSAFGAVSVGSKDGPVGSMDGTVWSCEGGERGEKVQ